MKSFTYRRYFSGTGLVFASALMIVALNGCQSKQDAAIEQAKKQAASTGQTQTVTTTDKSGNTVTTTVQPPAPGQKDEVVTMTVTPKAANPAQAAVAPDTTAGTAAGSAAAPATTAAAAPPPAPAPPPTVNVPAGTPLAIRIDHTISAKHSHAGERFTGEIVDPVKDGTGSVVIPKGSDVRGVVVRAKPRGHFKGAATIELRLTSLKLNGQEYPLETRDFRERKKGKGKRTAGLIAGGSGLGMLIGGVASGGTGLVIGGLAGAGAGTAGAGLTGNRDLVIPAESIVHFKLSDDLTIQP
ncbi:MAG TPA: hypothetical protein VHZ52_14870 [Acidobacteriaceae bacterium]|jgi:hypothetical protein|nr:hypothetical protein [Acidobacteriaceae bacterium]